MKVCKVCNLLRDNIAARVDPVDLENQIIQELIAQGMSEKDATKLARGDGHKNKGVIGVLTQVNQSTGLSSLEAMAVNASQKAIDTITMQANGQITKEMREQTIKSITAGLDTRIDQIIKSKTDNADAHNDYEEQNALASNLHAASIKAEDVEKHGTKVGQLQSLIDQQREQQELQNVIS